MIKPGQYLPKVREQYEALPYPHREPEDEKKRFKAPYMSRLDVVNHHCFKGKQNFENFRVLSAGGGTGDCVIAWAEQLRDKKGSEVVYLDMSAASMKVAQERAKVRGLTNIKWIHDSILNLPDLGLGEFDFINCTGVLHHLKDPDAGLKALQSVLKPHGVMNLMVYAPYGRIGVYQMQDLMRLINDNDDEPGTKLANTKSILNDLPQHHWIKAIRQYNVTSSDMNDDAGIYDLFLHSQDRSYTILEVHDWLERCGLQMTSEPGYSYIQLYYLPETYIKDKALLAEIMQKPLKVRQAIAENIAAKITTHEFFACQSGAEDTVARLTDTDLIPWQGIAPHISFESLAVTTEQQPGHFTVGLNGMTLLVHKGPFTASLLRQIDGNRNVRQIIERVQADPAFKSKPPTFDAVMEEFKHLFLSLNRGNALFLRDKSVKPYATIQDFAERIRGMYK